MLKKTLVGLYVLYFFGVHFLFSMGGGPYPLYFKLVGLPLLFLIPFIWALQEQNRRLKNKLLVASFVLPVTVSLAVFWGDISEKWNLHFEKQRTLKKYEAALLTAPQDPALAFLSCYHARQYHVSVSCYDTLKSVSDGKFCRNLCTHHPNADADHLRLCANHRNSLSLECAEILIHQMDPKSPYDLCKAAGLLNYRGPAGPTERAAGYYKTDSNKYFQGFYKRCLDTFTKDRSGEYRTLREILKLRLDKIPDLTLEPLPE